MRFENVSIIEVAYIDATHRVTSSELEERLAPAMGRFKAPRGLLESLTGIVARRFWDEDTQPSYAATLAAERAISASGIDRQRIGILINTSVSKDYIEPSVAAIVHGNLGLGHHALNFDIGNACLGFMNGIQVIGNMIEMGQIDYGLVVNGENSHFAINRTIDRLLQPQTDYRMFRAQFPTLTLGSGGVAMIIGRADENPAGHPVLGALSLAATEHNRLCVAHNDEMVTDSKSLLAAGIELSEQMAEKIHKEWGKAPDDVDEIVIHQVSEKHTDSVIQAVNLTPDKVNRIYPEYGNVGPAGVPMTLAKSIELGRVGKGDHIGLYGVGSGLNMTVMEVVW